MWGLITFGFSFVPIVGAFSIWFGGALYLFIMGDWPFAIGLAAFGLGIIAQADNVIKPWVMRGRVNIHPILLLLSILGGVQVMGPPGLIFGPVIIAILSAALEIYRKEFVEA
jgi:predicted PurR-regulated permease PerM